VISHETLEKSFPVQSGFANTGRVSSQVKALLTGMKLSKQTVRRACVVTY